MTNPRCAVCGHINRVGAAVCEMCDTHIGEPARARDGDPSHAAGESSASYSDTYSGASTEGFDASSAGFEPHGGEPRPGALPTEIPSPQFKGVGDVVSPTLEIYRKHFLLIGLFVVATTLPAALLQYAATRAFEGTSADGVGFDPDAGLFALVTGGGVTLLYWVLSVLGSVLLAGALAYAVVEIQRTGAARAGDCLRWGLRKMLKVFVVTLVTTLLVYTPGVLGGLMAAILGPLVLILFLLLLLPWIILILTVSLAVPAAAVENRGVIDALKRSAELTKGFKGLIFLTYFLWRVVIVILAVILG